ncbi:MAG: DUF4271 domain-containing protein [Bacteroidetes bacterium]|nr:DUF4271 domain-containing protein [Bacteroidota bacterium]
MSKSTIIIQDQDSLNTTAKDSNVPFLELIKTEDSSSIVVQKKKKNIVAVPVVPHPIPNLIADTIVQDSVAFELSNTNKIPIRKTVTSEKKTITEQPKIVFEPTLKNTNNKTWPSIVLTSALLLLAFTKAFGSNRIRQIYKSMFSYYSANEVVREEKVFFHQVNFSLFLLYLFTISLLLYFVSTYVHPNNNYPLLYPFILGMVTAAYLIKFVFNFILGYLFDFSQLVPTYIYNVLLYNYSLGIMLIPGLALIYFSDFQNFAILNFVILPLIAFVLLIRFIRFFAIGISNNVSYLYIILYICTLEILPLVVLGKFFIFK